MAAPEDPFVYRYLLDGTGRGREIEIEDVDAWEPSQGVLWMHLEIGNQRATDWLEHEAGLDPLIAEAICDIQTRPRSIATDKGLLLILRAVNTNPGQDPEDMVSIRIWVERDRVITVRRRKLLSIQDIRGMLADGSGPKTTGDFLIMLVERIAYRIGHVVMRIDHEVDEIDAEVPAGSIGELQGRISTLRRQTAAIRRYLAPQRDALSRIRGRTEILSPREVHDLEEQSDDTTRYLEDLDLLREQAILITEQLTTRMANEQNQRLYVLSIVAAIFLPLSFITGLLGMNVAGLPGLQDPAAFWISVGVMGGIAALLLIYFRIKRWI